MKRLRCLDLCAGGFGAGFGYLRCTCQAGCSAPRCGHRLAGVRALGVYGSKSDNVPSGGQTARTLDEGRRLMGIPWMSWAALVEAIPPAYTEYIGAHVLAQAEVAA